MVYAALLQFPNKRLRGIASPCKSTQREKGNSVIDYDSLRPMCLKALEDSQGFKVFHSQQREVSQGKERH